MAHHILHLSINGSDSIEMDLSNADTVDKVNACFKNAGVGSYVHALTAEEWQDSIQKQKEYEEESRISMIAHLRAWEPTEPLEVSVEQTASSLGKDYATLDQWPFEDVKTLYWWVFESY